MSDLIRAKRLVKHIKAFYAENPKVGIEHNAFYYCHNGKLENVCITEAAYLHLAGGNVKEGSIVLKYLHGKGFSNVLLNKALALNDTMPRMTVDEICERLVRKPANRDQWLK